MLLAQSLRMLGRAKDAAVAGREGLRRAESMLVLNPLDWGMEQLELLAGEVLPRVARR